MPDAESSKTGSLYNVTPQFGALSPLPHAARSCPNPGVSSHTGYLVGFIPSPNPAPAYGFSVGRSACQQAGCCAEELSPMPTAHLQENLQADKQGWD